MQHASYIIGIDLGTTNSTLAYTPLSTDSHVYPTIEQEGIAQIVSAGTEESRLSLPSFIYFPLPEELSSKRMGITWDSARAHVVGMYARERGAELPSRTITSAKSWLCHTGIDRREKNLPFESEEVTNKMSPLEACAEFLRHLKESWDQNKPATPFAQQQILITVPASFDPSARQLVQEAAQKAGYPEIVLLEEPQAAFYAWLYAHHDSWRQQLKVGDVVLVVDIGGGTTDFSLITVEEDGGNLSLRRLAVGSHLLLGGDNIDLALAYLAKGKLEEQGKTVDPWQFQSLIHQCRQAKELLMGENPPKSVDVVIQGRGSRLIGGSIKTKITKEEVDQMIVEGFIPLVQPHEQSALENRAGLKQLGLPYVQDPRISSQLAKFLSLTGESGSGELSRFVVPSVVLFNGGTMKATALRERLMLLLNQWATQLKQPPVKELAGADYDYAVSRGAAYYGLSRLGKAIRIRSGTSRSYFIGVEESAPAVPGMQPPIRAICMVPYGMEEGEEQELPNQEFALVLGEQATFRFFSHATPTLANGEEPVVGTVVRHWKQELTELHPIEAHLDKADGDGKTVRIKLHSKVTEVGTLELWCVAQDGRRWKLEFDIRKEH
jgi:molecular chaperone DnaK (HSP70)